MPVVTHDDGWTSIRVDDDETRAVPTTGWMKLGALKGFKVRSEVVARTESSLGFKLKAMYQVTNSPADGPQVVSSKSYWDFGDDLTAEGVQTPWAWYGISQQDFEQYGHRLIRFGWEISATAIGSGPHWLRVNGLWQLYRE